MAKKKRKSVSQQLKEAKVSLERAEGRCENLLSRNDRQTKIIKDSDATIEKLFLEKGSLLEMLNDSQAMTGRLLMQLSVCKVKADLENIPLNVKKWSAPMVVNACEEPKKKDA